MSVGIKSYGEDGDLSGTTVAVFGLGKMGQPLAAVLADSGASVQGVDIDEAIVEAVNDGRSTVDEPELAELVETYGGSALRATTDGPAAAEAADVQMVIVPTVLDARNEPDLEPVVNVAHDIAEGLSAGNLVILESTAPPGTTIGVFRDALESAGLRAGEHFGLAHCPERTSSGRVIQDLSQSYPKIIGGIDDASSQAAASLYRVFNEPGVIELPNPTAAEAVKVFEGVYRDTNIALANELALACEEWGLSTETVFDAANSQPYCNLHRPGIGVGGHCIPVYPHFVINRAEHTPLLETSRAVNDGMPGHAVDLLETQLDDHGRPISEARVLVLGLTFRPGVRELRYAPGVDVVDLLNEHGAEPFAHDPLLSEDEIADTGALPARPTDTPDLDGVILATGHESYRALDLDSLCTGMRTPVFVDGRNFYPHESLVEFDAVTIGEGTDNHPRLTFINSKLSD